MNRNAFFLRDGKYVCGVCGDIPEDQLKDIQGKDLKKQFHRATDAHQNLKRLTRPERSDKGNKRKDAITTVEA